MPQNKLRTGKETNFLKNSYDAAVDVNECLELIKSPNLLITFALYSKQLSHTMFLKISSGLSFRMLLLLLFTM